MDLSFDLKLEKPAELVGVIDIGSNSIKCLVAFKDSEGFPREVLSHTKETRLAGGIAGSPPQIDLATIQAGVEAIESLISHMSHTKPDAVQLVATSAVRDAINRESFRSAIAQRTGHDLRILTGEEEALGIAAGLQSDPAFRWEKDLSVFDIGGGSLEHIDFRKGAIAHAVSTELGAVRMTKRFVKEPRKPIVRDEMMAIRDHAFRVLEAAEVKPRASGKVVGTGGGFTISRRILAKAQGVKTADSEPIIPVDALKEIYELMVPMTWQERRSFRGLPKQRADIYPAAAATLLALAEYLEVDAFYHSFYNLRFGIARLMLNAKVD